MTVATVGGSGRGFGASLPSFQGGLVLFKKLFRVLVVGGAMVGATRCATGSSAKGSDGNAAMGTDSSAADGGTATSSDKSSTSSSGGGVMGW
jgi:hypothetical protein